MKNNTMTMKQCYFCTNNIKEVDYKSVDILRRFLNDFGRINKKRESGACAKHQRKLAKAVKQARFLALLPYIAE